MLSENFSLFGARTRALNLIFVACLGAPIPGLAQGVEHAGSMSMVRTGDDVRAVATVVGDACQIDVQGRPGKKFSPTHISVPSACKTLTVQLIHTGKKPKAAAGHNWVLVRESDLHAAIADGLAAGPDNDWVKPGDERVIAKTAMIGGGERTSVTFDASKLSHGTAYTYFCSFPSHAEMMRGTLSIE
ncbi:azurin [Pandoraea commovens]|uniref:Azurin n=1 Tax=Pandoraea commovens TaxID=2508289 RepID=A0ABY5QBL5_9BURK|nr:azurin [Pandoraea commovens]UVA77548.1 azurin [Pandoraea commovens]